jgi:hypothetical protein
MTKPQIQIQNALFQAIVYDDALVFHFSSTSLLPPPLSDMNRGSDSPG